MDKRRLTDNLSSREHLELPRTLQDQEKRRRNAHQEAIPSEQGRNISMKAKKNLEKGDANPPSTNAKDREKDLETIQDQLNKAQQLPEIRRLVERVDKLLTKPGGSKDHPTALTEEFFRRQLIGEGIAQDYIMSAAGQNLATVYQLSIQPLRKRFIEEYEIKTIPEHMLLDRIMFAYLRATQLDSWINGIFGKGSVDRFGMELYRVLEDAKERTERQMVRNLEALKRLKMPPLNLNIRRADNVNVADKQQVNVIQEGDKNIP